MSHELFINVTEEQQEIVAGGASLTTLTAFEAFFETISTIGPSVSTSGPGGSTAISGGVSTSLESLITTLSNVTAVVP